MQTLNITPIQINLLKIRAHAVIGGWLINKGHDQVFVDQSIEVLNINGTEYKISEWELDKLDENGEPFVGGNTEIGWLHLEQTPDPKTERVDWDTMVERISVALNTHSGGNIAEIANNEFGMGVKYIEEDGEFEVDIEAR